MKTFFLFGIFLLNSCPFVFCQTIAGGGAHALALCPDGTLRAWGLNNSGQLGDSATVNRVIPVQVHSLTGVVRLGSGVDHSVVLKNDGSVWTWGINIDGQLGDSTTVKSIIPKKVHGPGNMGYLSDIVDVAHGHLHHHNLALKNDSTVWAWGFNIHGQLGDSSTVNRHTPVKVYGLTGVTAITTGDIHSLALRSDSTVWGWGYNLSGQLGDSTTIKRSIPVKTYGLDSIVAISAGELHSLALKADGTVWGWGYNWNGQLGNGTNSVTISPIQVTGLTNVIAIATGADHSLALKSDSTVWAWGYNFSGQLGDSTQTDRWIPVKVKQLTGVTEISGGGSNSFAKKKDGSIWTWGMGTFGQLGNWTTGYPPCNCSVAPVQVTGPCSIPTGIEENQREDVISIYPNPAEDMVNVQCLPAGKEGLMASGNGRPVKIYNALGELKHISTIDHQLLSINVSAWPNGVYLVQLQTAGRLIGKKIVILH